MRFSSRIPRLQRCVGAAPVPTIVFVTAILALGGCASSKTPGVTRLQVAYEDANSRCRLECVDHITFGGLKMMVVKHLVRLADDGEAGDTLSHLKRVEVATYRVLTPKECADVSDLGGFERELVNLGWWPAVVEHDPSEADWVFTHSGTDGDLDGLFVVTVDHGEIEVVRLEGRIDRILADAVADDPDRAAEIVGFTH